MNQGTVPIDRRRVWILYLALVGGYVMITLVFGYLFFLHRAPLQPELFYSPIPWVMAALGLPSLVLGLTWARPRVPLRKPSVDAEAYWRGTEAGQNALLGWVLWEGSGIIGLVGTLLSGSIGTAALATIALALLLLHSPAYFETRTL